jgi:hypothetical protein
MRSNDPSGRVRWSDMGRLEDALPGSVQFFCETRRIAFHDLGAGVKGPGRQLPKTPLPCSVT